jgi:hypothetical protein
MADWNTRLAVSYQDGGQTVLITPIDTFSPTFNLAAETINSIEATHLGVIYNPQQITFSLTVKAIGAAAGQLTALAFEGTRFDIILQEQDGTGDDWTFQRIVMSNCIITSASTNAATTGAPTVVLSGFSLAATAEPKAGSSVSLP